MQRDYTSLNEKTISELKSKLLKEFPSLIDSKTALDRILKDYILDNSLELEDFEYNLCNPQAQELLVKQIHSSLLAEAYAQNHMLHTDINYNYSRSTDSADKTIQNLYSTLSPLGKANLTNFTVLIPDPSTKNHLLSLLPFVLWDKNVNCARPDHLPKDTNLIITTSDLYNKIQDLFPSKSAYIKYAQTNNNITCNLLKEDLKKSELKGSSVDTVGGFLT